MKVPAIELSDCVKCELCVDMCPEVFEITDMGMIQVIEKERYPQEDVQEVIKNCPTDCIYWEE